ncbi:hypothetical protein [Cerasicoccus frondis]|uniref:hypothetical protein n=1 Tax=Cerasicoccus frondis TaxID=490090 RepID=UPI002852547C|nr:hypothetical protein [Cerasicoccus frondis]
MALFLFTVWALSFGIRIMRRITRPEPKTERSIYDFADEILIEANAWEHDFIESGNLESKGRYHAHLEIAQRLGMFLDGQKSIAEFNEESEAGK